LQEWNLERIVTQVYRENRAGTWRRILVPGSVTRLFRRRPRCAIGVLLLAISFVASYRSSWVGELRIMCKRKYVIVTLAAVTTLFANSLRSAHAVTVSTAFGNGADIELTENGGTGGVATAGGNGTKVNMNARWNGSNVAPAVPDKNEWAAARFDLSEYDSKASLSNVLLKFYMHRANANNNKNLHFYAIAPGTAGENWPEASTTYATMPGFTFDMDSITRSLATDSSIVDLGTFTTTGSELEGALSTVTLPSLTTLVQGMGTNDLLTVLITTTGSTNGQWRALTKEATGSETGVISGAAGAFAPFLEFSIGGPILPGDYNDDNVVNGADYVIWRDNVGTTNTLPNDTVGGTIGEDQYNLWRSNFGSASPGNGSVASLSAVPEVPSIVLAILAMLGSTLRRALRD
jgi:hypothetical protein